MMPIMMGSLKKVCDTEKAFGSQLNLRIFMKVNIFIIRKMVLVFINGQMAHNIRAISKMICKMAKECLSQLKDRSNNVFGVMGKQ